MAATIPQVYASSRLASVLCTPSVLDIAIHGCEERLLERTRPIECARLNAESYADDKVSRFIAANFVPVRAHLNELPSWFHRFEVSWTPKVLITDSGTAERRRIEGDLPKAEFLAELHFRLARLAFKQKKWSDSETKYGEIAEHYPDSAVAPEAQYWTGVSQHQRTHDPAILTQTGKRLAEIYPASIWTKGISVGRLNEIA